MGGWFAEGLIDPIRGRLRPVNVQETTFAVVSGTQVSHIFYCAADADIQVGDKVVLGTVTVDSSGMVTGYTGTVINIRAIKNPSYMSHHLECWGTEVQ